MRVLAACCLLVITPAASAIPGRQPAAPVVAIAELLDAYDAGRFDTVDKGIAAIPDLPKFSVDLQLAARPWVSAGGPERAQRRRLIAAAVALEAAGAHMHAWFAGRELLAWGAALARQGPPTDAERVWYLAAVGIAQGAYDTAPFISAAAPKFPVEARFHTVSLVSDAVLRFPVEDRFHLAGAIARELASWRAVQFAPRLNPRNDGKNILRELVKAFEPLLARASIRAEVHLRLGQTYLRLGQPKAALEHLERVVPLAKDPFLRYLANYMSGKAREAMADAAGAEADYRRALEIVPRAQSASFALAALAFDRDARDQAHALVESAISGQTMAPDPWRAYQAADFRFWTSFAELVRKGLR
jgi:tetratricopeptide (TPR) repeat protein